MLWRQHITQAIAIANRGANLEESLKLASLDQDSPSQLARKLQTAIDARLLYAKALRMFTLLQDIQDDEPLFDVKRFRHTIEGSVSRLAGIIEMLHAKLEKWGFGKTDSNARLRQTVDKFEDTNTSDDYFDIDALKSELKHSLKALSNIVDYMEKPTLLKIRKEINKLVSY